MKPELKQHIIKVLEYLKDLESIDDLTIGQIDNRFENMHSLLREFVELCLNDKENENGTMTDWWLYDIFCGMKQKDMNIYSGGKVIANLTKVEDFVNFMINRNDKNG